jgi:hypothetical protein
MPAQFWRSVLNSPGVGAGTALASSTTLTDISPAPQLVLPANYLYVGQRLRATAYGILSTTSTPTLTLGVYYGGVASPTTAAVTGTITTPSSVTAVPWQVVCDIYVRTIGSSGTLWMNGTATIFQTLAGGASGNPLVYSMPATQTMPITVSTVAANALTVGAVWGTSSSSNTITCEDLYVEALS